MPDIFLRIQVGDAVEVVKAIETQLEDPSELMQDVLLFMIRSTQLTFEAQGRPSRWTPLAQSTVESRLRKNAGGRSALKAGRRSGVGGDLSGPKAVAAQNKYFAAAGSIQILRDTGGLMMSVGGNASGAFESDEGFGESDKFTATLGTNKVQAVPLQFIIAGGRPFLLIQDEDEEDIMDATVQFVMKTGPYA